MLSCQFASSPGSFIARRGNKHGSGLGRWRWVVERTFAWLHSFRRPGICWERDGGRGERRPRVEPGVASLLAGLFSALEQISAELNESRERASLREREAAARTTAVPWEFGRETVLADNRYQLLAHGIERQQAGCRAVGVARPEDEKLRRALEHVREHGGRLL